LDGGTTFQCIKLWQMADTYRSCVEGPQYPYYIINYIKKNDVVIINNQQGK